MGGAQGDPRGHLQLRPNRVQGNFQRISIRLKSIYSENIRDHTFHNVKVEDGISREKRLLRKGTCSSG